MNCFQQIVNRVRIAALVGLFIVAGVGAVPASGQTFRVVGAIPPTIGPIENPAAQQVVQGRNGELYTISGYQGGLLSATTAGAFAEVAQPFGNGVTLGSDGNLYTAQYFDRDGCGEVWKTTPTGTSTELNTICGIYGNGPEVSPTQAPNGIFYGPASEIPSGGAGTIYSITSSGTVALVYNLSNATGSVPVAPLVVGSDGELYGGTRLGGSNNDGVLFRITTGGTYTVLHNFAGSDGADLERGLFLASDGNLYGVTQFGGTDNNGVFFKLTSSGAYTVLYNFPSTYPPVNSSLMQATDGNFYGLIEQGNSSQPGWIFSLSTTGTFTIVHTFCQETDCTDGIAPSTPLMQDTNGNLYGFTVHGGDASACDDVGCGVLYSLDIGAAPFASLESTSGKEGARAGIFGQGFNARSVVKFGGTQATAVTPGGTGFLSATVPAGALTGAVTVTTGSTTLTSSRTFDVTPTMLSFSPSSGSVGTSVTISGTGLLQTTKVAFNGKSASFSVVSDSEVNATVPAGATSGRIKVATRGGSVQSSTEFTVN